MAETGADPLPDKRPRRPGCLRRTATGLLTLCLWGLLAAFAFTMAARFFWIADLLDSFRFQMFALLLPAAIIAWVTQRFRVAFLLSIATILASLGTATTWLPTLQPPKGDQTIRIMSFNVLGSNRDWQSVIDELIGRTPDVIAVVEFSNYWPEVFKGYESRYPYQFTQPRWHGYGVAIFSKFPLTSTDVSQLLDKEADTPIVSADLEIGSTKIRLLATHLISPVSQRRATLRNEQMVDVAEVVNRRSVPTVLVGDFNCATWSPFMQDLLNATGLRDSRNGFGFQGSWENKYPWLMTPIDHALVSPTIHVHRRFVGGVTGSDHLPVIVEVSVMSQP